MYAVINSECEVPQTEQNSLVSEGSASLNLLACLGYDSANPPLADLLKRVHRLDGDWLILSPIHWQATHNDALIVAAGKDLNLDETEAKNWFALFAEHFAAEGMSLYYHDTETWLLRNPKNYSLNSKPVYQLLNKSLMPVLSQLDETLFWQKLITESQMLCATKSNDSLINGVWPWGNAPLTAKTKKAICADETFFPLVQECSNKVSLYNPAVTLKDYEILLVTDLSVLSESHQQELKQRVTHWYWNNCAYTTKHHWYTRLWRKLTYAY